MSRIWKYETGADVSTKMAMPRVISVVVPIAG